MMRREVLGIYLCTFIGALCSIVYELMFSQLFTIIFGGTVRQYSITIGLYLFSLGIGSYLYGYVRGSQERAFVLIEMFISLVGLIGLVGIILVSGYFITHQGLGLSRWVLWGMSYLPVILVGMLSGIEIPLLAKLGALHGAKDNVFGKILGTDYLGSLAGTLLFALLLYPALGIIMTAFIISLLNLLIAVYAVYAYKRSIRFKVIVTAVLLAYLLVIPFASGIQDDLIKDFRSRRITGTNSADGVDRMQVNVTTFMSTPYQDVMIADVKLDPRFYSYGPWNYTCLYLDNDQQFCDPLVESYHGGMVDVPMQFLRGPLDVLVIGGGDWIGVKNLLGFEEVRSIDLVDIDERFALLAKQDGFISRYNGGSFEDSRVNTLYEDGFYFALSTDKSYDMIIVDLPGVTHDKLAGLYSVEFFSNLNRILREGGLVVTWVYDASVNPAHARVFDSTLRSAGFTWRLDYLAYRNTTKGLAASEKFSLFALQPLEFESKSTPYLDQTRAAYQKANLSWKPMVGDGFSAVRPNSVFRPNHDIVIPVRGV